MVKALIGRLCKVSGWDVFCLGIVAVIGTAALLWANTPMA